MAYDFTTDVQNLTRITVDPGVLAWAVDSAKTLYIGDDPTNYDEDKSTVDNKLVSILASAFVSQYNTGAEFGSSFSLDEFSIESKGGEDIPFFKFLDLFENWLRMYQERGIALQYKDIDSLFELSAYDPTLYQKDPELPEGIQEN